MILKALKTSLDFMAQAKIRPTKYYLDRIRYLEDDIQTYDKDVQEIAYQHFVMFRRPKQVLFAEQRYVFKDFFPKDTRMIKADIHLKTNRWVEVGDHLTAAELAELPHIEVQTFHDDTKLYTIAILDGDKVRADQQKQTEEILYLKTQVPLSMHKQTIDGGIEVFKYLSVHPTRGSRKHRYIVLVFEDAGLKVEAKRNDAIWSLVQRYKWQPRGVLVLTTQWDPSVTRVFEKLGIHEPYYVEQPKQVTIKARNMYVRVY